MNLVLAIDPGNTESAYALINAETCRLVDFDKVDNDTLQFRLPRLSSQSSRIAIEMVASYGMAVGAEVFETCVWIGRFTERIGYDRVDLVKRLPVKLHHCHDSKAKDTNIRQALVDRFAPGQPNHGKGIKAEPGWFHGFHSDIWAAYALAVYVADTQEQP
jgi:hypothetical protein